MAQICRWCIAFFDVYCGHIVSDQRMILPIQLLILALIPFLKEPFKAQHCAALIMVATAFWKDEKNESSFQRRAWDRHPLPHLSLHLLLHPYMNALTLVGTIRDLVQSYCPAFWIYQHYDWIRFKEISSSTGHNNVNQMHRINVVIWHIHVYI